MAARFLLLTLVVWLGGCQHGRGRSGALAPPRVAPLPLPAPKPVPLAIRVPDHRINPAWLDTDEFFPPGARRILGETEYRAKLLPPARVRFPSADPLWSPDGKLAAYSDGTKRRKEIFHWLMVLPKDAMYPHSLYCTATAFEVSWSPDSSALALTDYVGNNSSEVHICSPAPARSKVDLRRVLEERFPERLQDALMFVKAYRWGADGRLLVRAIGRAGTEPYELFGCEVLVDVSVVDALLLTFLRGFIADPAE